MEYIFKLSDRDEIYSYVKEYIDGYGFAGVYLDKHNNLTLVYAPEDRIGNDDLVKLRVSREFVRENKAELDAGEGLKIMLPRAIEDNYKNILQLPTKYLDDKEFTAECIKIAEKTINPSKTDERTK